MKLYDVYLQYDYMRPSFLKRFLKIANFVLILFKKCYRR